VKTKDFDEERSILSSLFGWRRLL